VLRFDVVNLPLAVSLIDSTAISTLSTRDLKELIFITLLRYALNSSYKMGVNMNPFKKNNAEEEVLHLPAQLAPGRRKHRVLPHVLFVVDRTVAYIASDRLLSTCLCVPRPGVGHPLP